MKCESQLLSALILLKRYKLTVIDQIITSTGIDIRYLNLMNSELSSDNPWFIEKGYFECSPEVFCLLSCRKYFVVAYSQTEEELKEFAQALGKETFN